MNMKKSTLATAMGLAIGGASLSANAVLTTSTVLNFTAGTFTPGPTTPAPGQGSWFSMLSSDTDGDYYGDTNIYTAISPVNGVTIGVVQTATGSHGGAPGCNPSKPSCTGAGGPGENPDIDAPWSFFGSTGMHQTTSAVTELSTTASGAHEMDFTGWDVTWNGIASIPMGGDTTNFPSDTGIATITCTPDPSCPDGSAFTLNYLSHVPLGDPSNFGGVQYGVYLEGTISQPGAPPATTADTAQTISGNTVQIPVLANDTSADGYDATTPITISTAPTNGAAVVTVNGTAPQNSTVDYTPNASFSGTDSLQYTAKSGTGVDSTATDVTVTVQANVAPVANNDSITASDGQLNNAPLNIVVLTNDTDANNTPGLPGGIDTTTVTIVSQPSTGTCTVNSDGSIDYSQTTPAVGGQFSCTYTVSDIDNANPPLTSNVATVDITVTATQSDWPTAVDPDVTPVLVFEQGVLPDPNFPPTAGSYFSMQVDPSTLIFTPIRPGPDGGLVIGGEQDGSGSHTGSPTGNEQASLDQPWVFFSNTGLHYTRNGGIIGNPDGTLKFNTDTEGDGRWAVTWNGVELFDLGGNPTAFPEDLGFGTINCTPAPCADQSTYVLDYAGHVPVTAPNFAGVPYKLHLEGTVVFRDNRLQASNGIIGTVTRSAASEVADDSEVDVQCAGSCFDYTITGVTDSRVFLVLPLAGGVPRDPVWRIEDNGTWRSFDTSAGDTIKSAALAAGATTCPAPNDAAYGDLTTGHQCIQLGIADNGLNDLNPALGTISDPSGLGGGGAAGGGTVFVDTRTSDTTGCTIAPVPVSASQRGDWWLLAGFLGALGWARRKLLRRAG